jgi:Spy/CpxP family protein refolding chaperone
LHRFAHAQAPLGDGQTNLCGFSRSFFQIKGDRTMKGKSYFLSSALFLVLASLLLVPALGQTKEDSWSGRHKMRRATLVKELKLSPDKAKDFNAVGDKYAKDRQELIERLKKSQAELQNALAAATPDEAKIKDLVAAIRSDQEKMAKSFQSQKDEDLALMTPVQQGRYLMLLHKKMKQK